MTHASIQTHECTRHDNVWPSQLPLFPASPRNEVPMENIGIKGPLTNFQDRSSCKDIHGLTFQALKAVCNFERLVERFLWKIGFTFLPDSWPSFLQGRMNAGCCIYVLWTCCHPCDWMTCAKRQELRLWKDLVPNRNMSVGVGFSELATDLEEQAILQTSKMF